MSVCVIDLGLGNISCVTSAVGRCLPEGQRSISCVKLPSGLSGTPSHIILPGVGTFSEGMRRLHVTGWEEYLLRNSIEKPNISFLGICLGMQMLATIGYEGTEKLTGTAGLNIIASNVVHLSEFGSNFTLRIPHIGWNNIIINPGSSCLFDGISGCKDFFFMHSYAMIAVSSDNIVARCDEHSGSFVCVVRRKNYYGVQFHPEKSQGAGSRLISNFLELC